MSTLAGLLGAGTGTGLLMVIHGWRGIDPAQPRRRWRPDRSTLLRGLAAIAAAVLVGAVTGWVAAGLLAGLAAATLPRLLGRDRDHAIRLARLEAVAVWAEMLRDTLSAAAGLEQAIIATAPLAPVAIHKPVAAAVARLQAGDRLPAVLQGLADELTDPTADLVICALQLAAEQRASHLADLLGSLAAAARDHAALRMRIHASRAQMRTEVRITVAVTLAFAVGLLLLDRRYLGSYATAGGQLVLLVTGALFTAGFWLLARIARLPEPGRFLTKSDEVRRP